jgi:hypothetical protein
MSEPAPRKRVWAITLLVDLTFLIVAIGAPVWAFTTVQPGVPEESTAGPLPDPDLLIGACAPVVEDWRMDCYLSAIFPVLDSHGVAEAFALLQELANRNPWVLGKDHPMAHSLGREAFKRIGDAGDVLVECPYGMASGCFHGTLEAFLSSRTGNLTGADVATLCLPVDEARGPFGYFQCLHGLGHGVTMFSDHDMQASLELCDALPDWWTRESCYGGVFMENIVSYQVWSGLGVGEGILHNHDDEEGEAHHGWIYADDPQYPCNVVADKYLGSCYNLQTTAFLTLNGYDVRRAFTLCGEARADWIHMCYLSMGRDISSISQRVAAQARDQCGLGDPAYREWCIVGVVKDFINSSGRTQPGLEFCAIVLDADKPMCYKATGEILITLMPDKADRWNECALAEEDFIDDCRAGAAI